MTTGQSQGFTTEATHYKQQPLPKCLVNLGDILLLPATHPLPKPWTAASDEALTY
jgi:hypothetical protein